MAFVNKKRKKIGIELDVVGEVNKVNDSNNSTSESKFDYQKISWEDNAIDIINTLSNAGIDIYSEARRPGMYLKTSNNQVNNIMNIIESEKDINNNQQQSNKTQKDIDNLIDLFG